ncbi:hypothetical protein ACLKA7_013920 [Drosophila subpalustris]
MSVSSDLNRQIDQLTRCEILKEIEVKALCAKAHEILIEEENIQRIDFPVIICVDTHGQFFDLKELFKVGSGDAREKNYLFLGDFVGRCYNSVETFLLLLALKVRYPDRMVLIRGNHKCRQITQVYGFYDECLRKYGTAAVWRYCTDIFDYLSLSAITDGMIFCVHAGLSPSIQYLDQIRCIDRKQEIKLGVVCHPVSLAIYVVSQFNRTNDVHMICQAHQLVMEGFKWHFNERPHHREVAVYH